MDDAADILSKLWSQRDYYQARALEIAISVTVALGLLQRKLDQLDAFVAATGSAADDRLLAKAKKAVALALLFIASVAPFVTVKGQAVMRKSMVPPPPKPDPEPVNVPVILPMDDAGEDLEQTPVEMGKKP